MAQFLMDQVSDLVGHPGPVRWGARGARLALPVDGGEVAHLHHSQLLAVQRKIRIFGSYETRHSVKQYLSYDSLLRFCFVFLLLPSVLCLPAPKHKTTRYVQI